MWVRCLRRRPALSIVVAVGVTTAALSRSGGLGHAGGDDWSRYDHRTFAVTGVTADACLRIDGPTTVRLLGVAGPLPSAADWLGRHPPGRRVTLLLPTVGVRGPDGCLNAYAFDPDDGTCVNVELVRAGLAHADRRMVHPMAAVIYAAAAEARRKGRTFAAEFRADPRPVPERELLRPATPP